jgi:D-alanyl-D-alanine carboxypeptidase
MRFKAALNHRASRVAALLLLLSITVLTALWQQTSASTGVAAAPIPKRAGTPSPTAASTPTPAPATPTARTQTAKVAAPTGITVSDPASLTVVVNKQRALLTSYVPAGLVVPNVALRYSAGLEQSHLRAEAAAALEQLVAGAAADGLQLQLVSGYRSAAYQTTVYNNAVRAAGVTAADQGVARPGHSEHQTGLAADLGRPDGACDLDACFGGTAEGRWLAAHAADYGFIIRYPAGQEPLTGYEYEPWHIRYVGPDAAHGVQASGQTLESYFGLPFAPGY